MREIMILWKWTVGFKFEYNLSANGIILQYTLYQQAKMGFVYFINIQLISTMHLIDHNKLVLS